MLVSAVTPTKAGEGKTATTIGLVDALRARAVRAVAALRQPSVAPTLGNKGGGAGGGRARLEPFARINLGLTGDLDAIAAAHNLLAALCDHALHFDTGVLDPRRIDLPRVLDVGDRALRSIVVGLGGATNGMARESRFDVTAASEVTAIVALARDYADLKRRLSSVRVGRSPSGSIVTARDLRATSAMSVLLRDAMLPNLVRTAEGSPALVHGAPFGNIAHGCSSVASLRFALARADVVVTEAGFGFDLGGEKYLDIVARDPALWPDALVMVTTVRASKTNGVDNLRHHLEAARRFSLDPMVALNVFEGDDEADLRMVEAACQRFGARCARISSYAQGAEGGLALADLVLDHLAKATERPSPRWSYDENDSLPHKIETIARTIYGASAVDYSPRALRDLQEATEHGLASALVCMAKTHLSLSADPDAGGAPRSHVLPVRAVRVAAGAGYVVPLCGEIMTMPGLGRTPALVDLDLDDAGNVVGVH